MLQGYFSPVVVKYASSHQEKIKDLILLNPPVCITCNSTIQFSTSRSTHSILLINLALLEGQVS